MSARRWLGLMGIGVIAIGAIAPGQAQPSGMPTMDALLAEVRGLRAELNQAAGTSIRTQLLVARLQLQEQRITGLAKQLTDVQTQRSASDSGINQMQARLKQLEEHERNPALTPEQRKQVEGELAAMRLPVNEMRRRQQQLTEQESALSGQLASEQSRWIDFNDRLDQIEREIAAARQPR
jgi:septal ring factor EnvC (AmiA/AmiB activator)